jgi:hypothetical protein
MIEVDDNGDDVAPHDSLGLTAMCSAMRPERLVGRSIRPHLARRPTRTTV